MDFIQKIRSIQRKNKSLLCVGLDPDIRFLPKALRNARNPFLEFNRSIIEATSDLVCAYKLNVAFYESLGEAGWKTIHRTLEHIPRPIVTIGDGKRGDIGNTAERQAYCFCEDWKFDASTVNPLMGEDSVVPFLKRKEQGAFILALTSNPGARDFQYLKAKGKPLYEHIVAKAKQWNVKRNIGLVVGATHPAELKRIRSLAGEMPILIPGIGAQHGNLDAAVRFGCDRRGELAVITIGRGIIGASGGSDFAEEARAAALAYRDQMSAIRQLYFS